jgi:predicted nucleic acid-binding protein
VEVLIDTGPIVALYNETDDLHQAAIEFFGDFEGDFITTCPVVTECMWLLPYVKVQKDLLERIAAGVFRAEPLTGSDFHRIAELKDKYGDRADLADLSLIAVSERLNIQEIVTFDADFDFYRRLKNDLFIRYGFDSASIVQRRLGRKR